MRLNRNVGRDALLLRRTDYLNDSSRCLFNVRGVIKNFSDDNLPRARATRFALRDQDTVRNFRVVRNDKTDTALTDELPGNFPRAALEYLNDGALGLIEGEVTGVSVSPDGPVLQIGSREVSVDDVIRVLASPTVVSVEEAAARTNSTVEEIVEGFTSTNDGN